MSEDIVQQLRRIADCDLSLCAQGTPHHCEVAADEIERLRAELAECRGLLREACEAWSRGTAHYPVPMGEVFNGAVLSKSWYKRAVAEGGG